MTIPADAVTYPKDFTRERRESHVARDSSASRVAKKSMFSRTYTPRSANLAGRGAPSDHVIGQLWGQLPYDSVPAPKRL